MSLDPQIKNQLIEARQRITAQLDELYFRATAKGFARRAGGPPDYRGVYAELESELNQINEILKNNEADDA